MKEVLNKFNKKLKFLLINICVLFKINDDKIYLHNNQLILEDPYNTNQGYHPKIICFNTFWNGYKYWMAFTPYPKRNFSKENPCINVSNDLKKWICPKGLINPLDIPDNTNNSYNSDTHLLYNRESNRLELFWRFVDNRKKIRVYTKYSYDGINWSQKKIFLRSENMKKKDFLSPSIIYENGKYKIWYVFNYQIYYMEKEKGKKFTKPRRLNIHYKNNVKSWHIDVYYNNKKKIYELLTVAHSKWELVYFMSLYYLYSKDNIIWSSPIIILQNSKNKANFDSQGIYRSSLIFQNNKYFVVYSGHSKNHTLGIGLVYGRNIKNLKPYIN